MVEQNFPKSWSEITLGEICRIRNGYAFKSKDFQGHGIPLVRQSNLTGKDVDLSKAVFLPDSYLEDHKGYSINKGDIILGMSGSIGEPSTYKYDYPALQNQRTGLLQPFSDIDIGFVRFFLESSHSLMMEKSKGMAVQNISAKDIEELSLGLPPVNEQKQIVDRIEQLFSDMDKGEELLKTVQKQLATYRQSVLKAAVTGELTKDWREKNKKSLESGKKLLARILETRRKNWKGRGKYPEAEEPKDIYFSEIPETWVTATIDQIASAVDYGSSAKCSSDNSGVAVLRMGNIQNGILDLEDLKYLPQKHEEFPKLLLDKGDLLFNRTNSAELVGKTAIYKGQPKKCSFASYLIRVKLIDVEPEYISAFINSAFGRAWIKAVVSQQVGQANVNGSKLKSLAIPLPPKDEQQEVVQRLENIFSQIDVFGALCAAELSRSATLRQSILKSAFSGKLVAQDPADEPASELLARIKSGKKSEIKPKVRATASCRGRKSRSGKTGEVA